ncbi:MAG: hypothetical protein KF795_31420, partial [Labilithrix sp.]|nr:hypothetical protein [Labilithrix sp.]
MSKNLIAVAVALLPIAALVACSVGNGDATGAEVREAGTLEASNGGGGGDDDDDDSSPDDGEPAPIDAGKDARADADAAPPLVEISELYVDIDGFGDGAEFVEL